MEKKKQLDRWKDLPAVTTFCIPFVHCHLNHSTEVLLKETDCYSHCTSSENSREMPTFMVRPFSMLNCNTVARCKHRSHINQNSSQSRNRANQSSEPEGPKQWMMKLFCGKAGVRLHLIIFSKCQKTHFFFGTVKAWAMTAGQQSF